MAAQSFLDREFLTDRFDLLPPGAFQFVAGGTGDLLDWLAAEVFAGRVPVINFSGGTEVGGSFLAPYPVEPIPSCSLGGPSLGMDVDVVDDQAHLRVENRVLPAGPTVVDTMANAAFYYGVVRGLVELDRPLWSRMSFNAAAENLQAGARAGMDAQLYWPDVGWVRPDELVLRRLLVLAEDGLQRFGVSDKARKRYLSVIEGRCISRQTGSVWQRQAVAARERAGESRTQALHGMLRDYVTQMHEGEPVHTWEV